MSEEPEAAEQEEAPDLAHSEEQGVRLLVYPGTLEFIGSLYPPNLMPPI